MLNKDDFAIKYTSDEYFNYARNLVKYQLEFNEDVNQFLERYKKDLKEIYISLLNEDNKVALNDSFNNWIKVMYIQYTYNQYKHNLDIEINSLIN